MRTKFPCPMCDRSNTPLSDRGWCFVCEEEFTRTMAHVRCALSGGCNAPTVCMMEKRCTQVHAGVQLAMKL